MHRLSQGLAVASAWVLVGLVLPTADAAAAPTCHGLEATLIGSSGDDTLVGTSHADVIVGLGGDDTIRGMGGNDVICGGDGADTLDGGAGKDRLYGGPDGSLDVTGDGNFVTLGDTLNGGTGNDLLVPGFQRGRHTTDCPSCGYVGWYGDVVDYSGFTGEVHLRLGRDIVTGQGTDRISARHLRYDLSWGINAPSSHLTITGTPGHDITEVTHASTVAADLGKGRDNLLVDHSTHALNIYLGPGDDGLQLLDPRGKVRAHLGSGDDNVTSDPEAVYPPENLRGGPGKDQALIAGNNTRCFNIEMVTTSGPGPI